MDDPWGSPWADETSNPIAITDTTSNVVISSKQIQQPTNISPWNIDDGLAEWEDGVTDNAPDVPQNALTATSRHEPDNETASQERTIQEDVPRWPEGGLSSSDDGRATRQSPYRNGNFNESNKWINDFEALSNDTGILDEPDKDAWAKASPAQHNLDIVSQNVVLEGAPVTTSLEYGAEEDIIVTGPKILSPQEGRPTEDTVIIPKVQRSPDDVASPASRPSLSPSDRSHHDEHQTETPRTSFGDTPKRPRLAKKGSSKVSGLVQLFNGLAEESSEGVSSTIDLPKLARSVKETDLVQEDADDFGDFEEGDSDVDAMMIAGPTQSPPSNLGLVTEPGFRTAGDTDPNSRGIGDNASLSSEANYGDLRFVPNLTLLDDLFCDVSTPTSGILADAEIVDDTSSTPDFTSTEQRKLWYRISRYGTMRKHNAGDDESYVRINWGNSCVRTETLKIVGKWMEADRIHGSVVLGGSGRLRSLFGWGQSEPSPTTVSAAAVGEVLELQSQSHKRLEIAAPKPMVPNIDNHRETSATEKVMSGPTTINPPVFSWSTSQPSPATKDITSSAVIEPTKKALSPISEPPLSVPSSFEVLKPLQVSRQNNVTANVKTAASPTSIHPALPQLSPLAKSKEGSAEKPLPISLDDDDEWGEMVSSPAIPPPAFPAFPTLPSPRLGHKSSRSLMNIPGPQDLGTTDRSRGSHRPSVSVSEGLAAPGFVDSIMGSPQIQGRSRRSTLNSVTPRGGHRSSVSISEGLASQGLIESIMGSPQIRGRSRKSTTSSAAPPNLDSQDPWASADFSFFDVPVLTPKPAIPAHGEAQQPPPLPEPVVQKPPIHIQHAAATETEQDRIVQDIIRGLPDLSYMLRR